MAELLRIFVSATADIESERAVIGRVLAGLPVQIGAEIRRTPAAGASYDDIFELIANCDRVYFLLGQDITAPSGAEWFTAWQLERSILPLRTPDHLTPAGREFLRTSYPLEWTEFRSSAHLARLITLDLVKLLNHANNRYGLSVAELDLLKLHARRVQATTGDADLVEPGGAEGGGVLLEANALRNEMGGVLLGEAP